MAIVTALVLLAALGLWQLHRRYAQRDPVVASAQRHVGQGAPALTEDDVITFGLALEATNDVVEELLADKD